MRKPVRFDRASGRQSASSRPATPGAAPARPAQQNSALGQGCGVVLAILFVLILVGKCSSGSTGAPGNTTQTAVSEPAYVTARSLNCRREPEASAAISEGLARNDQVVVTERRGEWVRLTRAGGDCWVSGTFLANAPVAGTTETGSPTTGAQGLMSTEAGSTVAAAGAGYVAGKSVRSGKRYAGSRRRGSSRSHRGSGGGYSGSGCPCSGSQVCIGPRGGRYCITSGGNKRYGV